jgi:hypothetical protein
MSAPRSLLKGDEVSDSRRERSKVTVSIRKQQREARLLQKRRAITESTSAVGSSEDPVPDTVTLPAFTDPQAAEFLAQFSPEVWTPSVFASIDAAIRLGSLQVRLAATHLLRCWLSLPAAPPINEAVEAGLCPLLTSFLLLPQTDAFTYCLVFEACWCLTNLASGDSTATLAVANKATVTAFVSFVSGSDFHLTDHALWALANICGDSEPLRDLCLTCNLLPPLLAVLQRSEPTPLRVLRNAVFTASNICRLEKKPHISVLDPLLRAVKPFLRCSDPQTLFDAVWTVSYVAEGDPKHISMLLDLGIITDVIKLLSHPSYNAQAPALRCVGNCIGSCDAHAEVCMQLGAIPPILSIALHSQRAVLRREATWAVSNLAAGTIGQIEHLLRLDLAQKTITLLSPQENPSVRREAVWIIANVSTRGSWPQMEAFIAVGCIPSLISILAARDSPSDTLQIGLETVSNLFAAAKTSGHSQELRDLFIDANGLLAVQGLQDHEDYDVYAAALMLLEGEFPQYVTAE